jgi:hypothetical protein
MPIGISFFKVPCKLLHSLHVPPNSLENILEVFIGPRMRPKEGGKTLLLSLNICKSQGGKSRMDLIPKVRASQGERSLVGTPPFEAITLCYNL